MSISTPEPWWGQTPELDDRAARMAKIFGKPAPAPAEDELRRQAFMEFSRLRKGALAEGQEWLAWEIEGCDDPLDFDPGANARAACAHIEGAAGDLAHWVWTFELSEREREIFRAGSPMKTISLLCGNLAGQTRASPQAFEPGDAGAQARRHARAFALAESVRQARHPEDPLFPPAPAPSEAGLFAALASRAIAKARSFLSGSSFNAAPHWEKLSQAMPAAAHLDKPTAGEAASPQGRALREAVFADVPPAQGAPLWPTQALRSWLAARELANASEPARSQRPRAL